MKKPTRPASHNEFQNWGVAYDPRAAQVTPGYVGPQISYRDERDARLQGVGLVNGYADEAIDGAVRTTVRSYTRGVHVGERLNPSAYMWPDEFRPTTALELESKGLKWAPADTTPATGIAPGANAVPGEGLVEIDPSRQAILAKLLPNWH